MCKPALEYGSTHGTVAALWNRMLQQLGTRTRKGAALPPRRPVTAWLQATRCSTNSLQGQPSSPATGAGLANERTATKPNGARNDKISSDEADS